jgi:hypothetical protein
MPDVRYQHVELNEEDEEDEEGLEEAMYTPQEQEMLKEMGVDPNSLKKSFDKESYMYEEGFRPRHMKFDLYCGLGSQPDRKYTTLNTPMTMPWLAIAFEKAADLR